jgi:hypothetical protein
MTEDSNFGKCKLLQNHVTILDGPSLNYEAIKSSRYYFVLYIFSIYKMLKTLTNKCIKFYFLLKGQFDT